MKHILIVEDDEHTTRALGLRLKSAGYKVSAAYDAGLAVLCARELRPALVILDLTAADPCGYQVARRMQRDTELAGIPLVLVTPGDSEELPSAVGAFVKPYDPGVLVELIDRVLSEPEAQRAA